MPIDKKTGQFVSIEEAQRRTQSSIDQGYSPLSVEKFFPSANIDMKRDENNYQEFTPQEMEYMDRYGVSPSPGTDLNERLAEAQSSADMLIKGIERLAGTTATKTGQGVGYLLGLADPTNWGSNWIANASDNAIAKSFEGAEEWIKQDLAPMFQSKEDADKGVLQRMATDLNFWTDDMVDGVAFMASTYLPGGMLSKLGMGERTAAKILEMSGKYKNLAAAAAESGQIALPKLQGLASKIDTGTQFALMSSSEALFEADGVRTQLENQALQDFQAGKIDQAGYDEAIQYSKRRARDTYIMNMAALAPSNLLEASLLTKALKGSASKTLKSTTGMTGTFGVEDFKYLSKGTSARGIGTSVGKGFAAEGLYEENIQHSIEKVNSDFSPEARTRSLLDNLGKAAVETLNVPEYDKDRWTSIVLGGLIGGPSRAIMDGASRKEQNKIGAAQAESINKAISGFRTKNGDIYERDAKGNVVFESDGRTPKQDPAKIAEIETRTTALSALNDIISREPENEGQVMAAEYAKGKAFSQLAMSYFQAGQEDQFMALVDSLSSKSDSDLINMGFDPLVVGTPDKAAAIKSLKQKSERLKNLYDSLDTGLLKGYDAHIRKQKLFDVGADILHLQDMKESLRAKMQKENHETMGTPQEKAYLEVTDQVKRAEWELNLLKKTIANDTLFYVTNYAPHVKEQYNGEDPWKEERAMLQEQADREEAALETMRETQQSLKEGLPIPPSQTKQRQIDLLNEAHIAVTQAKRSAEFASLSKPSNKSNYSQILVDLAKIYDPSKFSLSGVSPEGYKQYEDSVVDSKGYSMSRDMVDRKFTKLSSTLPDRLTAQDEQQIDATTQAILAVGEELKASPGLIDKDQADALNAQLQSLKDQVETIDEDRWDTIELPDGTEITQEVPEVVKAVTDYTQAINAVEQALQRHLTPNPIIDEDNIRFSIADTFLNGARTVKQNYELNQEYDKVEDAKEELQRIQDLQKALAGRTDSWIPVIRAAMDSLIRDLNTIIPELEARRVDKEKAITRAVEAHRKTAYSAIGLDPDTLAEGPIFKAIRAALELSAPGVLDSILADAKKDPTIIYPKVILTLMREYSKDNLLVEPITNLNDNRIEALYQQFLALPSMLKYNTPAEKALHEAYKANPDLYFIEILRVRLRDYLTSDIDRKADSSLIKYIQTRDFEKLAELAATQDRTGSSLSQDELLRAIAIHKELSAAVYLKNSLNSEFSIGREVVMEILNLIDSNITPSEEQIEVARRVVEAIQTPTDNEMFKDWVLFSGFAGTGKTSVVAKWVKNLLFTAKANEVVAVSANPAAMEELNNALDINNTTTLTPDNLAAWLSIDTTHPDLRFVFLDEIGSYTKEQLESIARAVSLVNKDRAQHRGIGSSIKVIGLGDPNQINSSGIIGRGPFEDRVFADAEKVGFVPGLIVKFRSDVPSIVDFQDLFLQIHLETSLAKESLKVVSNVTNVNSVLDTPYGVYASNEFDKDLLAFLKTQDLTDGKKRAIIVNEEEIPRYTQLLRDNSFMPDGTTLIVASPRTIQGATVDQAFINYTQDKSQDVNTYHGHMYTATSRPKEFILLGGFNAENTLDSNLESKVVAAKQNNENRKKTFLENRAKELEVIKKYIPGMENVESVDDLLVKKQSQALKLVGSNLATTPAPAPAPTTPVTTPPPVAVQPTVDSVGDKVHNGETLTQEEQDFLVANTKAVKDYITAKYKTMVSKTPVDEEEDPPLPAETDEAEPDIQEGTDQDGDQDAFLNLPEVGKVQGPSRVIAHPTSNNISRVRGGEPTEGFQPGQEVHFILNKWSNKGPKVVMIAKHPTEDKWIEVGVIGAAELETYPEIKAEVERRMASGIANKNFPSKRGYQKYDVINSLGTSKITSTKYMKFNFGLAVQPFSIKSLLDKVVSSIYKNFITPKEYSDLLSRSRVVIFTDKTLKNQLDGSAFTPKLGFPYLEIPAATGGYPVYVPLARRKLNTNTSQYYDAIQSFTEGIEKLEQMLPFKFGDPNFAKYLRYIYQGRTEAADKLAESIAGVKVTNVDIKLAKEVYELYKRPALGAITTITKGAKVRSLVDQELTKTVKGVVSNSSAIVKEVLGDKVIVDLNGVDVEVDKVNLYPIYAEVAGKAQMQLNVLAKANLRATINGVPTMLRIYKKDNRGLSSSTAQDLLSTSEVNTKADHTVELMELMASLENKAAVTNPNFKRSKDFAEFLTRMQQGVYGMTLEDFNKSWEKRMTLDSLKGLIAMNAVGESAAGLRVPTPINKNDFNFSASSSNRTADESLLQDFFNTSLESITPTTVEIEDPKVNAPATPPTSGKPAPSAPTTTPAVPTRPARPNYRGRALSKVFSSGSAFIGMKDAMKYLKKVFGENVTPSDIQVITRLQMMHLNQGEESWGYYMDGVMYLESGATKNGSISREVLRHEAFHRVWDAFIPNDVKLSMLNHVRSIKGMEKANFIESEEYLARQYQSWRQGGRIESILLRLFKAIKSLLGFQIENRDKLEAFFKEIESGKFSKQTSEFNNERPLVKIIEEYGSVEVFDMARGIIIDRIGYYLNPDQGQVPARRSELIDKFIEEHRPTYDYLSNPAVDSSTFTTEDFAILAMMKQTKKGDYKVLKNLIDDHYGEGFQDLGIDDEHSEEERSTLDNEVNLQAEIEEGDRHNHEKKTMQVVKDFLSTIVLRDNTNRLLNSRATFKIIAERLFSTNTTSREAEVASIEEAFDLEKAGTSPEVVAVGRALIDLINSTYETTALVGDVEIDLTTESLNYGKPKFELQENQVDPNIFTNGAVTVPIKKGQTNEEWFADISKETGIPVEALIRFYRISVDTNALNGIYTSIESLREKIPTRGQVKYVNKKDPFVKVKVPHIGKDKKAEDITVWTRPTKQTYGPINIDTNRTTLDSAVELGLTTNVDAFLSMAGEIKNLTKDSHKKNLANLSNLLAKLEVLPFPDKELFLSPTDLAKNQKALETLYTVLQEAKKNFEKNPKTYKTEEGEEVEITWKSVVETVLEDQKGDLVTIRDAVSSQTKSIERPSNYSSGDGTKRWRFMNSSQAMDSLKLLTMKSKNRVKAYFPTFFGSNFYELNPFTNGKLKIYGYVDHDTLIKDPEGERVVAYKQENLVDYLTRLSLAGFLGDNYRAKDDANRYYQFIYPPSNKPETRAADVKILSHQESITLLREALIQESKRPKVLLEGYRREDSNFGIHVYNPSTKDYDIIPQKVLPENASEKEINERVNAILKGWEVRAEALADKFTNKETILPANFLSRVSKLLELKAIAPQFLEEDGSLKAEYKMTPDEFKAVNLKTKTAKTSDGGSAVVSYNVTTEFLKPYMLAFYMNNYMNGYFLNQTLTGDQSFFKNEYDEIKRMSIAHAIGYRGRVGRGALTETFNCVVVQDPSNTISPDWLKSSVFQSALKRILGSDYNPADAQGFILDSYADNLREGFSKEMRLGEVMKPVHYEIDEHGIPRAMKYSAIVLTERLCNEFPGLGHLRDNMIKTGNQQLVFGSAFKVGSPKEEDMLTVSEWFRPNIDVGLAAKAQVTLNHRNFRMQLNPRHEADAYVRQPSQLMYFLNASGRFAKQTMNIYSSVADIIELGRRTFIHDFKLTGRINDSKKALRFNLMRNWSKLESSSAQVNIMENSGISLNFPMVAEKIQSMFNSSFSKSTVRINYPGGKLVLQSAVGTGELKPEVVIDPKTGAYYGECYLPKSLATKLGITEEDLKGEGLYMLGFRIPSTELHSAVPLKVKGFYPGNDNIIIAPEEIVLLHGSDFDVDSLFVMRESVALTSKGTPATVYDSDGNILIQPKDESGTLGHIYTAEDTKALKAEYTKLTTAITDPTSTQEDIDTYKKLLFNEDTGIVIHLQNALKNDIFREFMSIIRGGEALDLMMTPISVDRVKGEFSKFPNATPSTFDRVSTARGLEIVKKHKQLYKTRDLNDAIHIGQMHQDNFAGSMGTGIYATLAKGYNYLWQSVNPNVEAPSVREKNQFSIDGIVRDKLSRTEKVKNEQGEIVDNIYTLPSGTTVVARTTDTHDLYVNAAIDNVKEQILSIINSTNATAKAIFGLTSTGVPLDTVVAIMLQPSILELSKRTGLLATTAKQISEELMFAIASKTGAAKLSPKDLKEKLDSIEITTEDLYKSIGKSETHGLLEADIENQSEQWLYTQLKIIEIFKKADAIGTEIQIYASIANLLKELPVTYADIEKALDTIASLYETEVEKSKVGIPFILDTIFKTKDGNPLMKEDVVFEGVDVLKNVPHINSAVKSLKTLKTANNLLFNMSNKFFVGFSDAVRGILKLRLGDNVFKSNYIVRQEFMRYLINGMKFKDLKTGAVLIDMDITTEAPYMNQVTNTEVFGGEAWVQRFIKNEVMPMRKLHPNNIFLKGMTIRAYKGLYTITFPSAGQMDQADVSRYTTAFNELSADLGFSEFQYNLVKYLLLTQGGQFAINGYGLLVNPEIYRMVDGNIQRTLGQMFTESYSTADGIDLVTRMNNVLHHFALQLALNNTSAIRTIQSSMIVKNAEGQRRGSFKTDTGMCHYDLAVDFNTNQEDAQSDEPQGVEAAENDSTENMFLRFGDSIYVKVFTQAGVNYYQEAGMEFFSPQYVFDINMLSSPYSISTAFDPSIPVKPVKVIPDLKIGESHSYTVNQKGLELKPGDRIGLRRYADVTRVNVSLFDVVSVEGPVLHMTYTGKLETQPVVIDTELTDILNNEVTEEDQKRCVVAAGHKIQE